MKYFLYFLSFVFLCIATFTGYGVGIKLLQPAWFCVTLLAIAAMFSAVEIADAHFKD